MYIFENQMCVFGYLEIPDIILSLVSSQRLNQTHTFDTYCILGVVLPLKAIANPFLLVYNEYLVKVKNIHGRGRDRSQPRRHATPCQYHQLDYAVIVNTVYLLFYLNFFLSGGIKVTGHVLQPSSNNRHCALNICPLFIKSCQIDKKGIKCMKYSGRFKLRYLETAAQNI